MTEYIDREAAIKLCNDLSQDGFLAVNTKYMTDMLSAISTADVAPVRRGRWISDHPGKRFGTVVRLDKDGCPVDSCHCSECGEWLTASDEYPVTGRYCPNCGAKMEVDDG